MYATRFSIYNRNKMNGFPIEQWFFSNDKLKYEQWTEENL